MSRLSRAGQPRKASASRRRTSSRFLAMTLCSIRVRTIRSIITNHLFYQLQVMHEVRHPFVDVRVCWQPSGRFPSFRDRSPAASNSSARPHSRTCSGRLWRRTAAGYTDRPPTDRSPTPPGRNGPGSAARPSSMAGRPTATPTASGVSERSEPLTSRVGDYWGACGQPDWNGRTSGKPWSGAFVTWVMAQSGYSAVAVPARRSPRQLPLLALRPRAARRAARRSCFTRRTNIRRSRATSSASARAARPGATPIRAPRTGASTTRRPIATSSPTCAAASSTRSAAT